MTAITATAPLPDKTALTRKCKGCNTPRLTIGDTTYLPTCTVGGRGWWHITCAVIGASR